MVFIEKTVFISYRRTNVPWALAIRQNLTNSGFDVFFDFMSIKSGDFEQIITENIRARAHFLILLTPSALERCNEPKDWFRREIEMALDSKRNIIPILLEGFDFGAQTTLDYLSGKLANIQNYNGLNLYAEYFDAGMEKLRNQFLNISLDKVRHPELHPVSPHIQKYIDEQIRAVSEQAPVDEKALTAQEWFERAFKTTVPNDAIRHYTKAIEFDPKLSYAYYYRGNLYKNFKRYEIAIQDFNQVINLNPSFAEAYYHRGNSYANLGKYQEAIQDFSQTISLNPEFEKGYNDRGTAYANLKQYKKAIQDYDQTIKLNPEFAKAYFNRGNVYNNLKQYVKAIQNFDQAIKLNSEYAEAFFSRGYIFHNLKQYEKAIRDYDQAIKLNPKYGSPLYNKACIYAGQGNIEIAVECLRLALGKNPEKYYKLATKDSNFDKIRGNVDFQKLLRYFFNYYIKPFNSKM